MYKVFFSPRRSKKNRDHNDYSPETNNEINEIVNNLEPETEINVHAAEQTNGIAEQTNGVAEQTNGVAEQTNGVAEQNNGINEIVNNLEPGTEINVHTADQIYYNALFLAFDHKTNKVSLLTDRFYKKRGNRLTILECNDIIGIDLPVSGDSIEKSDNEDE